MNRYTTIVKRNVIANEMFAFGVIQGIQIALCLDDISTCCYDCELFEDVVIYRVDTTLEKYNVFNSVVKNIYPTLVLETVVEEL